MTTTLTNLNYASDSDVWVVLEVPQIAPNVEAANNASGMANTGSHSSVEVVRSPEGTMIAPPGYAVDVYDWFVEWPIDSDGSMPDAEIRFQVGEKDVSRTVISAGYSRIMNPRVDRLAPGGKHVPYATSMRLLYNLLQKGTHIPNMALQILGLKVPSQQLLKAFFKSSAGWGQSGTALRPLRLYFKADMWTAGELGRFGQLYDGRFSLSRHPNGTVKGHHVIPSTLDDTNVDELPNGTHQTGQVQLYRKLTYATNNQSIGVSSPYILSTKQAVGGQQNNVTDNRHDLGFAYKNTSQAFIPYEFGLNFSESLLDQGSNPQIYVGWYQTSTRTILPNMYANGLLVSGQRNPFQYGQATPQVATRAGILPLAPASKLLNLLVKGANMSPVVSAIGLDALKPNEVYVAVGGIEAEGV